MLSFSTITKYSEKKINKKKLLFDKTFKISKTPNILREQNIKNKNHFKRKFNIYINTFYNTLEKENINTDLFLKNLQTLLIEEKENFKDLIYIPPKVNGFYDFDENKIVVLEDHILTSIYHELLHCASSKKVEDGSICGFSKKTNKINIGRGLNEGYTILLEERYFGNIYNQTAYTLEKHIASMLEKIIGKDIMTKLYFDASLQKLIKVMGCFSKEDDIYEFLINIDKVNSKKNIEENLNRIAKFLLKYYFNKMENLRNNNLITNNQFIDFVGNFAKKLATDLNVKGEKYTFITLDEAFCLLDVLYNNTKKTI